MRGLTWRSGMFLLGVFCVSGGALGSAGLWAGEDLCGSSKIISMPATPNLAATAEVTECGLLEFEQTWTRIGESNGHHADFLDSGLRYGLGHNLDVRWGADLIDHDSGLSAPQTGMGDTGVTLHYLAWKQTPGLPAVALQYGVKLPSADPELGTGYADHNIGLLASKDFGKVHLDYNLIHFWLGGSHGYTPYTYMVAALSGTLHGGLGAIIEFSGDVQPRGCPYTTLGLTYQVNRRFNVEAGAGFPLGPGEANNRILVGFTYSLWKHVSKRATHGPEGSAVIEPGGRTGSS